jgi:isoleucyl-tRNA synthetase
LQTLKFRNKSLEKFPEILELVKEEVNVKEAVFDESLETPIWLDDKITADLKAEGLVRELMRMAQDLRQKSGLKPGESIELFVDAPPELTDVFSFRTKELESKLFAKKIEFKKSEAIFTGESEDTLDGNPVWIGIRKISD